MWAVRVNECEIWEKSETSLLFYKSGFCSFRCEPAKVENKRINTKMRFFRLTIFYELQFFGVFCLNVLCFIYNNFLRLFPHCVYGFFIFFAIFGWILCWITHNHTIVKCNLVACCNSHHLAASLFFREKLQKKYSVIMCKCVRHLLSMKK